MGLYRLSLVLVILLGLLVHVMSVGETNSTCSLAASKSPHLRLNRYLFCDYDITVRPVIHHKNATNISIHFDPLRIDFMDESSTFILHTWNTWSWMDEFLTWNPKDFDGINETRVESAKIWTPDLALYNSADMTETQIGIPSVPCILVNDGQLVCIAPVKYVTHCTTDFTYWPYDEQTCNIRLSSWNNHALDINIDYNNSTIEMGYYKTNNEWDVRAFILKEHVKYYDCCPETFWSTIVPTFILRRHPSMVHTIFITTAFVFTLITLTVSYLDARSNERVLLSMLNFVCHVLIISVLHWVLPHNGPNGSPHLLLFYRDSWIIATFEIALTALLRRLQSTRRNLPYWLIFTVSLIEGNRICRFLLLGEQVDVDDGKLFIAINGSSPSEIDDENASLSDVNLQNSSKNLASDSWRKVTIIIERLVLIFVAFTYLMLFIVLIPREQS
ncbi:nicotinic acetylcholine receptor alpha 10 subunit precursor [Nasonia vitripennis]|uniref:Nicotinic acetylcholine receptor subunit alpha 10 n=1 Tax=Nasonia vitripennis TaxID=7425 RepID=D3UA22_NASVI|nr:nicotinic acetylcholine receptor alpha 10 subunit precursor [Nasonia vitripennis]ACY82695.1 nicotinic acetylcholine receptor subunit alpha 10 [Nasonia vitripennis]